MDNVLTIEKLDIGYDKKLVNNIDLKVNEKDLIAFLAPNNAGKSTLIKMLYREEKPTRGEINIAGVNVAKLWNSRVYKLRRRLGIVFQDYRLLPKLTVYENVAFALEAIGEKKSEIRVKTLRAIELVGLKSKIRQYPDQLSGGEQQRVAIARAIVNNPKILLCDEPTGNLDTNMSDEVVAVLDEINKTTGTTIIMATHDKAIVDKYKKRVIAIKEGRIVSDTEEGRYNSEII